MDEEEEDVKPATKSKGKSAAKSGGKAGKSGRSGGEEGPKVKTLVLKGKAPVDPECSTMLGKSHVFYEGKDVWDCMLNQTNVSNNNNKYYLIQLLEEDAKKAYYVWQRWGRVGYSGQNNLVPCGADINKAKQLFCKKFADKTKNDWSQRNHFVKDYINLICDVKSMEDAVIEMKYDAKKAPLGKLTEDSVKAGYAALKKIETCINKNDFGRNLTLACDEFYTRIPHDFGMKVPPIIRTKEEIELKMQLLEALGDIEIALKTLKKGDRSQNPIIDSYLQNTHASTHNQYKMKILDLFEVEKEGESAKFNDLGNRQLLWHGSRLTNWVGILSQGLKIAPPEAPVTGYMFGKGVYFADMSSKSANYCFATRTKNVGTILLCETNDLLNADYNADKLPAGKHSVKGLGSIGPDPSKTETLPCGTVVPLGKGKNTGVKNPSGYTLNYNEYILFVVDFFLATAEKHIAS
ncbi:hypothetical protein KUTeg_019586 [Tegillarca granosa]|uniref:Poly [ADP-ribose] polymerase n=1 Tax=Tegillarca granosa TaxID=220873 RepID=A0ABQ9EI58_TEGGR|nr:hypothetical protein KUTeg_019586 [Tegillarca granosa]